MNRGWVHALLALIVFGCFAAAPAAAHRMGVPVTSIEWNDTTQIWEVTHRLSVHDFDAAMEGKIAPSALYDSDEGQALIANYVDENFALDGADLAFIGAELERDTVWVYYELSPEAVAINIDSDLLMDSGKTDHALVNVKTAAGVQTFIFTAIDGPKQIELVRPPAP